MADYRIRLRGGSTMTLSAASGIAYLRAELSFTPLYYGCM